MVSIFRLTPSIANTNLGRHQPEGGIKTLGMLLIITSLELYPGQGISSQIVAVFGPSIAEWWISGRLQDQPDRHIC
ncbi:hypothetical protein TWF569_010761 [Orbilia oligospora]|uniref:Uncharacterized protein n=1 Tax=Orbilia oligospora TaxID=2813651 RepID=A0A7C8JC26_ORBOL|nr:hypothetical protein TWF102_003751 [Orbilia oligospora]KAF3133068.1 hypothetical protein TWF569_010761 [Orbilia oligospora]KAF3152435.1 hypothetical protein TWF594_004122 [Orbilia oligospora]